MKFTIFDSFLHYIYKKTNSWVSISIFGVLTIVLFKFMQSQLPEEVLKTLWTFQLTVDPFNMDRLLNEWGVNGINAFLENMWLDYIFSVCYAIFMSGLLSKSFNQEYKQLDQGLRWMVLVPLMAMAFDYIENSMETAFLINYPDVNSALIQMGAAATAIKWFSIGITIIMIVLYGFKGLIHHNFSRRN